MITVRIARFTGLVYLFGALLGCSLATPGRPTPVELHGQLRVEGVHLVDHLGDPVQLRGMSSHGLQWDNGSFTNPRTLRWIRDEWGASVIRAAMYVEEGGIADPNSSPQRREELKQRVYEVVDDAVDLGLYVIVDWHVMASAYPGKHQDEAIAFFKDIAERYGHLPNIIYETANEPHDPDGDGPLSMTWIRDIKPYHEAVIQEIRKLDSDGVVIAATNQWNQRVNEPFESGEPLNFDNVLYALHFYACSHSDPWLFDEVSTALANGLPIFVSEWGTTAHDGKQRVCEKETRLWMDFLKKNNISWVNWSLSGGSDQSAAFKEGVRPGKQKWSESDLKPSGLLVKKLMQEP